MRERRWFFDGGLDELIDRVGWSLTPPALNPWTGELIDGGEGSDDDAVGCVIIIALLAFGLVGAVAWAGRKHSRPVRRDWLEE